MIENTTPSRPILNLLVLIAVIGLGLAGWLTGHIVRHITPAYQHPPTEEVDPRIKTGYLIGTNDQIIIIGSLNESQQGFYFNGLHVNGQGICTGNTFFTSFPARCQSVDGKLVSIGGIRSNIIVIPQAK